MMSTEKKLQVDGLSCVRQHRLLFTCLSFELNPTDVLLVEGPNGSGKSSLLRLLSGLTTPTQGTIRFQGQPIQDLRANYWNHLHYMSHTNGIKLGLTVAENLQMIRYINPTSSKTDDATILESLQLHSHQNTLVRNLSAGQKRKVSLAKLVLFPKLLWILDEPLTALDNATQTLFLSRLRNHLHTGGMAVISSHHPLYFPDVTIKTVRLNSC